MNYIKRIEDLLMNMQNNKLSMTIINALDIALSLKDYKNWIVLNNFIINISNNSSKNYKLKCADLCKKEDISIAEWTKITESALSVINDSRQINMKEMMCLSVYEIEDQIEQLDEITTTFNEPDGLHPIDLYFLNEKNTKSKMTISNHKLQLSKIYSKLKATTANILIEFKQMCLEIEHYEIEILKGDIVKENIFIIHGHSEAKRRELNEILKNDFNLNPIILIDKPSQGMTIIEKFEKYAKTCSYAFAIFTPDDIVNKDGNQYFQVRPNVIFELGWFYATLSRNNVCIIEQESENSEIFSDLQGVVRMQFKANIKEIYMDIEKELKASGII